MAAILDFTKKFEQGFLRTVGGNFVDLQIFAAVPDGDRMHVLQYYGTEPNMLENVPFGDYQFLDKSVFNELFRQSFHPLGYSLSSHFAQAGINGVPKKETAHLYLLKIDKVQSAFADGGINGKTRVEKDEFVITPKGALSYCLSLRPARRRMRMEVDGALKPFPF